VARGDGAATGEGAPAWRLGWRQPGSGVTVMTDAGREEEVSAAGSGDLRMEERWRRGSSWGRRGAAATSSNNGSARSVESNDSVGLAVELNSGHNNVFSGGLGESTTMKDFGQDFGRRSSDKSCRPGLYTGAHAKREKMRGGGCMAWAPGGDRVPTHGPWRGKETYRWVSCVKNFQNKNKLEMLSSVGKIARN
jgi:hypothetical protein